MATERSRLKPDECIQKILISTTSKLVGCYESDEILISHAWQHFSNNSGMIREQDNPVSRSAFVIAFETEPYDKAAGIVIPDYSYIGSMICSLLSVLYGKRFDMHGLMEGSGMYNAPDMTAYNTISNHKLPFNSHEERKCFNIPLNLSQFGKIVKVFTDPDIDRGFVTKLEAACKFYCQSIQSCESDPEVAYLHLITAGEIIASSFEYDQEEVLDHVTLKNLDKIREHIPGGDKIARQISKQLLSIKRKFVKSLTGLIDNDFFTSVETVKGFGNFKCEDFEKRVGAAYDLRSSYVHTGVPFGNWITPSGRLDDIQCGKPVVQDKDFAKVLEKAPTYIGLERTIRYCILQFMVNNGFDDLVED